MRNPEVSGEKPPKKDCSDTDLLNSNSDPSNYNPDPPANSNSDPSANKIDAPKKWKFMSKLWEQDEDNKDLENELFSENRVQQGDLFDEIVSMECVIEGDEVPKAITSFEEANFDPVLMENLTQWMKYKRPTAIQQRVIPTILSGKDLIACSQTGTGKTAAYMLPIVQKILKMKRNNCIDNEIVICGNGVRTLFPMALILAPTRELATQIFDEARKFTYKTWIRPAAIYGGVPTGLLINQLHQGAHIVCCTLGKLVDLLDRNKLSLKKVRYVVLDEADNLFHHSSVESVMRVLYQYDLPRDESKQMSIFSATFPKEIRPTLMKILIDPVMITVEKISSIPKGIKHNIVHAEDSEKFDKLLEILYMQEAGQTLIFANSCVLVDTLDDALYRKGFPVTSIHSKRSQPEREDSITAFRSNKAPILIATSIAARGIDVPNILHVINYEAPKDMSEYAHRIGRTARIGNRGLATTFFNFSSENLARPLALMLKEYNQEVPDFLKVYLCDADDPSLDKFTLKDTEKIPDEYSHLLNKFNNFNVQHQEPLECSADKW